VAHRLVELFGGDIGGERDAMTVDTLRDSLPILVDGAEGVSGRMAMGGSERSPSRSVGDGAAQISHLRRSYGFPGLLLEEKAAARSGRGPVPVTVVTFRLADDPELGTFSMRSAAWGLAAAVPTVRQACVEGVRPMSCTLWLRPVDFTTPTGYPVHYLEPAVTPTPAAAQR
jgi:hypothetical protein